jgi:hypothetical protein
MQKSTTENRASNQMPLLADSFLNAIECELDEDAGRSMVNSATTHAGNVGLDALTVLHLKLRGLSSASGMICLFPFGSLLLFSMASAASTESPYRKLRVAASKQKCRRTQRVTPMNETAFSTGTIRPDMMEAAHCSS